MKELWINSSEKEPAQNRDYRKVNTMAGTHSDNLKNFLIGIINEINKNSKRLIELNVRPRDYFSIQLVGVKRYKNVVCFVKNEPVLSVSKYANLYESFFDDPPYNTLKRRKVPPQGLQLRKKDWDRYPHNLEYDLNKDKEVVLQLCQKACRNYRRS
jgi:hypothetical protein